MSGKGDKRRPKDIDEDTFAENWQRIFEGHEPEAEEDNNEPEAD